ncbi:class II aldolase/adducin family protein [Nocardia sputorum]|uniref:class II aldolase/adducin family protein n=1 Tax=Nocardia sputorum TaxID=2984338 RepID=UPI00248FA08C|nr:class II aldolase/adducin family protein [Nocardia sputorum]
MADSTPVADHGRRPSAETTIHTAVYRTRPAQAVVHIHPPFATALATRSAVPGALGMLRITDYELIKGLGGDDPAVAEIPAGYQASRSLRLAMQSTVITPGETTSITSTVSGAIGFAGHLPPASSIQRSTMA